MTAGIIDVPGHEDFVRTMVAGASGIDVAILVIAADEGIMPQTREHLLVLEQLRVPAGVAVHHQGRRRRSRMAGAGAGGSGGVAGVVDRAVR